MRTTIITIDANNNDVFGDGNDRIIRGEAGTGENVISWDGLDGLDQPLPAQTLTYNSVFTLSVGEMHFPLLDVENNPNGIIIERVNCDQFPCIVEDSTVFYNNSDLGVRNGNVPPDPISAVAGIDSSSGAQKFSGHFGDNRGIDTWTSLTTQPVFINGGLELKQADISVSKTHNAAVPLTPGGLVSYIIKVHNAGPSHVAGIHVQDNLPATITEPFWTCEVTPTPSAVPPPAIQNRCATENDEGPLNTTVDLQQGATAIFIIDATISPTVPEGATIDSSATITRPKDVTNPFGDQLDMKIETAPHSFTLTPLTNNPPVAQDKNTATSNDTPVQIPTLSAQDSDGSVVSYTVFQLPPTNQGKLYLGDPAAGGTLITEGQQLTPTQISNLYFKPHLEFEDEAIFNYQAIDDQGSASNTAKVTITVLLIQIDMPPSVHVPAPIITPITFPNQPPIADDKTAATTQNNTTITLPALSATDPDGTIESYQIMTIPPKSQGTVYLDNPAKGGKPIVARQILTPAEVEILFFKPANDFSGGEVEFTYTATDNYEAVSNTATVTIFVVANNKIPTALELELSPPNINLNSNLTVKGKLTSDLSQPSGLKDLLISLTITTPDGQPKQLPLTPTAASGEYHFLLSSDLFNQNGNYQLKVRFDGNEHLAASESIKKFTIGKIATTFLELELSPPNINLNGNLTVKGKLTSDPPQPSDLKDLPINLIITTPDDQQKPFPTQTAASGEYHFQQLSNLFNQSGKYQLKVSFAGNEHLAASELIKEFTIGKITTALNLELSAASDGNLIVSGQLSTDAQSNNFENLANLDIELTITYPDGHLDKGFSVKTKANGEYQFTQLPDFNQSGNYQLQTHFAGNENLAPINSTEETFTANKITTTLTLKLSHRTISPNDLLTVTGKLTSNSSQHVDLTDLPIELTITTPDGYTEIVPTTTLTGGVYLFTQLPTLNQSGDYQLQAHFAGHERLVASESTERLLAVGKVETAVDLELSSVALFLNGKLTAQGNLTSYPHQPDGLKDLSLELTIIAPDNQSKTFPVVTMAKGRYQLLQLPAFNQIGEYRLQTHFTGNEHFVASQSTEQLLTVRELAGYALLVQGRDVRGSGQEAYRKSLARVYHALQHRGFQDDDVIYFGYGKSRHFGTESIDDTPTKAKIQAALQQLQTRLNQQPAPIFIVMLDHGDLEGHFYLDNGNGEKIAPPELDRWLTDLETGLNPQALSQPRVIIISSCYSGHFLPALSQSNSQRVIITSTAAGEESYKGPKEPDGIRSGEYFLEALFDFLSRGYSLATAFELATQRTEQFTRADDTYSLNEQFQDYAVQHPLLDDNGDQQGSNTLGTEGQLATTIYLGLGEHLSDDIFKIESVTPTVYLNANQTSTHLWARINQSHRVKDQQVVVNIRNPNQQLTTDGTEQREQLEIELEQTNLSAVANSNEFNTVFNGFTQAGRYDLFYSVIDNETGNRLEQHSLVYKKVAGNRPPSLVTLRQPENRSNKPTTLIFDWDPSSDPEGEAVTYTFLLATDPAFQPIIYQQEGLRLTMTALTGESLINDPLNQGRPGLRDDTDYVWKVQAIDKYGEMTESPVFTFHTNNTNFPPGLGSLYVYNAVNFTSLENAVLDFWLFDENGLPILQDQTPEVFQEQGFYNLVLPVGRRRVTLHADGYQPQEVVIDTTTGLAEQQVAMIPTPAVAIPNQPGQLQFAVEQTHINEDRGEIAIIVQRVGGDDGAVSVAYYDSLNGSASRDEDYSLQEGQLTWVDQDSLPKKLLVTLHDDEPFEGEETFQLRLREPSGGATLGNFGSITITILDGDDQIVESPEPEIESSQPPESPRTAGTLQFMQPTYFLNEGIGLVSTFTVTRSDGNQGAITVQYTTTENQTAELGLDYIGGTGLLSWADGDDTPKAIELSIIDDSQNESLEKITLQLSKPTGGAQLGIYDQATLIIVDHDEPPPPDPEIALLQFASTINRVQELEGTIELEVTRTGNSQGEVSVEYIETLSGNATPWQDYLRPHGSLFWADGEMQSQMIKLTLLDDDLPEADKFINLVLVNPTGLAALGKQSETIIIISDDDPVEPDDPVESARIQFVEPIKTVSEQQGEVLIPVVRTGSHLGTISVDYETRDHSAIAPQDYSFTQGRLTWEADDNNFQSILIPIKADNQAEADEHFIIQLLNPSENVQLGNLAQLKIRIQDNDLPSPDLMLPSLGRGMALTPQQTLRQIRLDCQTLSCSPKTAFRGGSSINGLSYHESLQLHPYQEVILQGEIDVEAQYVGQVADLLVVAVWQPLAVMEPPLYFMQTRHGQLMDWDLNLAHLVAAQEQIRLAPTQKVSIYRDTLTSGRMQWFFGYRLADGVIVFNGEQAIEVVVADQ
jgi:uncharacterized repeat protein (TIGR01451 family)